MCGSSGVMNEEYPLKECFAKYKDYRLRDPQVMEQGKELWKVLSQLFVEGQGIYLKLDAGTVSCDADFNRINISMERGFDDRVDSGLSVGNSPNDFVVTTSYLTEEFANEMNRFVISSFVSFEHTCKVYAYGFDEHEYEDVMGILRGLLAVTN